jgi:hypothetical protein
LFVRINLWPLCTPDMRPSSQTVEVPGRFFVVGFSRTRPCVRGARRWQGIAAD